MKGKIPAGETGTNPSPIATTGQRQHSVYDKPVKR